MASIRTYPSQAPQSAHAEDDGDERGHAECEERPDEEERLRWNWRWRYSTRNPPIMWTTGTAIPKSDPRRIMTYPDRRPASTRVA